MKLYSEEFLEWANENEEDYIVFFEDVISEHWDGEPEQFLVWADKNVEDFDEFFEEYLEDTIEEMEEQDAFGTEGFNKRFG